MITIGTPRSRKRRSAPGSFTVAFGEGAVWVTGTENGVLTRVNPNNHVIEGADQIDITLSDGTIYPAKLVGTDTDVDLALLKMESKTPFQYVPWADSDKADVGQ